MPLLFKFTFKIELTTGQLSSNDRALKIFIFIVNLQVIQFVVWVKYGLWWSVGAYTMVLAPRIGGQQQISCALSPVSIVTINLGSTEHFWHILSKISSRARMSSPFLSPLQKESGRFFKIHFHHGPETRIKVTLWCSPLDKGWDLFENKRCRPLKVHGLLRDGVVSHQKAVCMNNQDPYETGGHREQDGGNGQPDDWRPWARCQMGEFPSGECEGSKDHDLEADVEFVLHACTLLRQFPVDAISHHGKWHSVEMVKSVADGMVAVIIGRVTVEAQMPFSWKAKRIPMSPPADHWLVGIAGWPSSSCSAACTNGVGRYKDVGGVHGYFNHNLA